MEVGRHALATAATATHLSAPAVHPAEAGVSALVQFTQTKNNSPRCRRWRCWRAALLRLERLTHAFRRTFLAAQGPGGKRGRTDASEDGDRDSQRQRYENDAAGGDTESGDEDESFEAMMESAALAKVQAAAKAAPTTLVDAKDKGAIAVGTTVVAIAYKPGGMHRDNLSALVSEVAEGMPVFLTYLSKDQDEVKCAAKIMCLHDCCDGGIFQCDGGWQLSACSSSGG